MVNRQEPVATLRPLLTEHRERRQFRQGRVTFGDLRSVELGQSDSNPQNRYNQI